MMLTVGELCSLLSNFSDDKMVVVAYDDGCGTIGDRYDEIEICFLNNVVYIGDISTQKRDGAVVVRGIKSDGDDDVISYKEHLAQDWKGSLDDGDA